jgi:IMP dehydrogenase
MHKRVVRIMEKIIENVALTFDDVLLVPAKSDVIPREVDVSSRLTNDIRLNIPLISAAMDTVTESDMAISMARQGGIGIIHKNISPVQQALEVDAVKRSESAIIDNPITMPSNRPLSEAVLTMRRYGISGIPIVDKDHLVGMLTSRDLRFEDNLQLKIADVMTRKLVTVPLNTSLEEARKLLQKHRIEKLLLVNDDDSLAGLITALDIKKSTQFPNSCKDSKGRLRVGAAVGTADYEIRVEALVEANVDVVTLDSAHGHSIHIVNAVKKLRKMYPDLQIIAGNIVTPEATEDLIQAGANAVKIGVGPGSICTTRVVAGVGVPQITAIMQCAEVADKYNIPVIADGGIKYSGDIAKALAVGASSVMIGSLFAGMAESPGESILLEGRTYKVFHGMGSMAAMAKGSKDRYFQSDEMEPNKLVPEGIEGRVPYRGNLADSVFQMIGGLRASMGYCGTKDMDAFRKDTQLVRITSAGLKESHPHDVIITKEAPNYTK